jgi:5-methylcytosine-specific restriction endonuclease McrA
MTNDESLKKWNQRLQIHHKDIQGRGNIEKGLKPNNDINNLQILCKSCHVSIDNKFKDYTGRGYKIWKVRRANAERNQNQLQGNG